MKSERRNPWEPLSNSFWQNHMKNPEKAFCADLPSMPKKTTLFSWAVLEKSLAFCESPASVSPQLRTLMEKLSSTRQIKSSSDRASVKWANLIWVTVNKFLKRIKKRTSCQKRLQNCKKENHVSEVRIDSWQTICKNFQKQLLSSRKQVISWTLGALMEATIKKSNNQRAKMNGKMDSLKSKSSRNPMTMTTSITFLEKRKTKKWSRRLVSFVLF